MKKLLNKTFVFALALATTAAVAGCSTPQEKLPDGAIRMAIPDVGSVDNVCVGWWGQGPETYSSWEFKVEPQDGFKGGNVMKGRFKEQSDGNRFCIYAISMNGSKEARNADSFRSLKRISFDYTCDADLTPPTDDEGLAEAFRNDLKMQFVFKGYSAVTDKTDNIYAQFEFPIELELTNEVKTCTIELSEEQAELLATAVETAEADAAGATITDPETGDLKPVTPIYFDWWQFGFFNGHSQYQAEFMDYGFKIGNLIFYNN